MSLAGKICLVTGASRGIGRGIALALGSEGATVYITGRTLNPASNAPGSLTVTSSEIKERGGVPIPIQCDHEVDEEIHSLFDRIQKDSGRIDLLVNNAFKGVRSIGQNLNVPFWEQDISAWDDVHNVGLRCHYIASQRAAKLMTLEKNGMIVNISSAGALMNIFTVPYGVGKAGVDKMSEMCAGELKKHNVTCICLWPGLVQTEHMVAAADSFQNKKVSGMKVDVSMGETVEFSGRAIVALMKDPSVHSKTGKTITTGDLGIEYGFNDADGRSHLSLRSVKGLVGRRHPWIAACIPGFIRVPWSIIVAATHRYY